MVQTIIPPQLIPQRQLQWTADKSRAAHDSTSSDQTPGVAGMCVCLHLPAPDAAGGDGRPCTQRLATNSNSTHTLGCNSSDGQPAAAGTDQCLSFSKQTDLQSPMQPTPPLLASLFGASAYLMGPPPPPRTGRADFACIKLRASALPPWRSAMASKALVRLLQS